MENPIEGRDFLVDWYAWLRVARAATDAEIRKEIEAIRRDYHPSVVYMMTSEGFADEARRMNELADKAERVLLRAGRERQAYDRQLTNWPGLLSLDGRPPPRRIPNLRRLRGFVWAVLVLSGRLLGGAWRVWCLAWSLLFGGFGTLSSSTVVVNGNTKVVVRNNNIMFGGTFAAVELMLTLAVVGGVGVCTLALLAFLAVVTHEPRAPLTNTVVTVPVVSPACSHVSYYDGYNNVEVNTCGGGSNVVIKNR